MTERRRGALSRSAAELTIGTSALYWDEGTLTIEIDERTSPLPTALRGIVRVHASALTRRVFPLDTEGRHHWSPIAPASHVEVALSNPALNWSGPGYLDSNWGSRPLEDDFVHWDWCRAPVGDGAIILYNATRRTGGEQTLALEVGADGAVAALEPPPTISLPRTRWRVPRPTRADRGATARVVRPLEDAPFYSRSVIETTLAGQTLTAMHESLQMDRFTAPWVQAMLPFRMPRW